MRILFDCRRSEDAWNHSKGRILTITELYNRALTRICIKHHYNQLPDYFVDYLMPIKNKNNNTEEETYSLRSYADYRYNYKTDYQKTSSAFYRNCISAWNKLTVAVKSKVYN